MMVMIRRLVVTLLLLAAVLLAWVAWNPPANEERARHFRITVPSPPEQQQQLWQVETRRLLREADAREIKRRLLAHGLMPTIVAAQEQVSWTLFTDAYSYANPAQTLEAQARWKQHGIDAVLMHDDGGYHLQLAREVSPTAIIGTRQKLAASKLAWRDETRVKLSTVWRLQFPPQSKDDAEITWRVLQQQGMLDPVMHPLASSILPAMTQDGYGGH
ncbi:MAG: hypothetical protein R8J84_03725 [Mariprofundales bacterium]